MIFNKPRFAIMLKNILLIFEMLFFKFCAVVKYWRLKIGSFFNKDKQDIQENVECLILNS